MKNNLRKYRAIFTRYLLGMPDKGIKLIGVTGTDGKSTTSEMIYQMMKASGFKTGLISTIGGRIGDSEFDTGLHTSTPSTWRIFSLLRKMKKEGVQVCILELTSHGLDQNRAYGIRLDGCLITNITPEHLDYHKTFDEYRQAKLKIIDYLKIDGVLAINADDINEEVITNYAKKHMPVNNIVYFTANSKLGSDKKIKTYSITKSTTDDVAVSIRLNHLPFDSKFYLDGNYNLQNLIGAVSLCVLLKVPLKGIVDGIGNIKNIPGRMNVIQEIPFKVVIDFAHTPNAFENVLSLLRSSTSGKLIVVFGCAGRRDTAKRKPMGSIASKYADIIILTAEDPRDEDIKEIFTDILSGIDKNKFIENNDLFVIESREEAIKKGVELLSEKDTLVLLGKGHEKSLAIESIEYPWNEEETTLKYLKLKNNGQ